MPLVGIGIVRTHHLIFKFCVLQEAKVTLNIQKKEKMGRIAGRESY